MNSLLQINKVVCPILMLLVLAIGATGIYYFRANSAKLEDSFYDLSQVKVSPLPADDHASQISGVDEIKETVVKDDKSLGGAASSKKSVCLDPGHGGIDPGAMKGKVWESTINLITANKVKALLEADGYTVFVTRSSDESLSKSDRYSFCNNSSASILVAIHHNSYSSSKINYSTALYFSEYDQPLAESIARSTSASLNLENKGIAWFDNSVLSKSKMPAVFSEAFFITNGSEYVKLVRKDYSRLDAEAKGIVLGISNYLADPTQFKPTYASEELKIDRTDW